MPIKYEGKRLKIRKFRDADGTILECIGKNGHDGKDYFIGEIKKDNAQSYVSAINAESALKALEEYHCLETAKLAAEIVREHIGLEGLALALKDTTFKSQIEKLLKESKSK